MTQQEADEALAEHRAVMAALHRECITRPTQEQYEATLELMRKELSCSTGTSKLISTSASPPYSSGAL
jgi:hypothetical protein